MLRIMIITKSIHKQRCAHIFDFLGNLLLFSQVRCINSIRKEENRADGIVRLSRLEHLIGLLQPGKDASSTTRAKLVNISLSTSFILWRHLEKSMDARSRALKCDNRHAVIFFEFIAHEVDRTLQIVELVVGRHGATHIKNANNIHRGRRSFFLVDCCEGLGRSTDRYHGMESSGRGEGGLRQFRGTFHLHFHLRKRSIGLRGGRRDPHRDKLFSLHFLANFSIRSV
mmetsp:Transcript_28494/g.48170  ORF Transcript_28494/g.48170 Transcript_28494/m.48170 type:complete len:227 (-) Transcript_28494:394-1074(-)